MQATLVLQEGIFETTSREKFSIRLATQGLGLAGASLNSTR